MVGGANVGAGPNAGPKILLAKPASSRSENSAGATTSGAPAAVVKLMRERDDENTVRTRLPHGSLSLISESWEIYPDRLLPLMSDNSDFTVIGVLGPSGVGKSTILNELYGFDTNSPGVLPPFSVLSDESKAMARHCSVGVELRMSAERFILLDTQLTQRAGKRLHHFRDGRLNSPLYWTIRGTTAVVCFVRMFCYSVRSWLVSNVFI
ncbi:hypothetical protein L7F22_040302 [Adiantum nelumboides]|nr:hypothetical protein [Adiantum nelumboides]